MPPHPTLHPSTSEADIIFNRAALALAKSQRLISSWLPPPTAAETASAKTAEEIEREEQEMFTPLPELYVRCCIHKWRPGVRDLGLMLVSLGLGATVPKDGEVRREELSSNERLREQLLGKDYLKRRAGRTKGEERPGFGVLGLASKPRPTSARREKEDDSDDEGGRSSLGRSKHGKIKKRGREETDAVDGVTADTTVLEARGVDKASQAPKRTSNYLDEVLAERLQKKRKKSRNKVKP